MATGNVVVTVVDVGQGQCTFVEIYNTASTPKLIHALLFDCGSDKQSDETQTNLQYIATKVGGMTTPAFDCIFFSHSDKDHISLTWDLLQKFPSTKKPVVKQVWYGGAYDKYTKNQFNILDYLQTGGYCTSTDIKTTGSNYTGYNDTTKQYANYLWRSDDKSVTVYPIVSNVLSDNPDWDDNDLDVTGVNAEALNRVSIICGLYYAGSSYVICGDATNKTMGAVNSLFAGGTTVFNTNLMTTLPHHGSRATGFAVKSSDAASFAAISVVSTFAGLLKSQTITVSAYQKHRHPSLQLMSYFIPTATTPILRDPRLKEKNSHRLTAYLDISVGTVTGMILIKGLPYSFETLTNTYTTRYFDGWSTFSYNLGFFNTAKPSKGLVTSGTTINGFACWQYETQTTGNYLLGGYANLALPLVLFTAPIITSSAGYQKIDEMALPDTAEAIVSPVFVRTKERPQPVWRPAHTQSLFHNPLKQFC